MMAVKLSCTVDISLSHEVHKFVYDIFFMEQVLNTHRSKGKSDVQDKHSRPAYLAVTDYTPALAINIGRKIIAKMLEIAISNLKPYFQQIFNKITKYNNRRSFTRICFKIFFKQICKPRQKSQKYQTQFGMQKQTEIVT